MEEINLNEIFQMFWKRKVPILIIVLLSLIAGCVYTLKFVTPKYSSSITMVLVSSNAGEETNSTITTTDVTLNAKLISTYSNLIKSKNVLKDVISNLGIKMDEEELAKCIEVGSIPNTTLIQITVTNEDNKLATNVVNEIGRIFPQKVKELYNIDNIQVMSEAEVPNTPSNINHKKDVILFAIFGVAVSILYVMVMGMLDTTIKGAETIETEFKLPVLTSIPMYNTEIAKKGGKK